MTGKVPTFRCDECGEEFECARSDDEARAEAKLKYGIDDVDSPEVAVVCGDCNDAFEARIKHTVPAGIRNPTEEVPGNAVQMAVMVGIIVRRYGRPVTARELTDALGALFTDVLVGVDDETVDRIMAGCVWIATTLCLIERGPDGRTVQASPTMMEIKPWWTN
jgi:hypothetical protein